MINNMLTKINWAVKRFLHLGPYKPIKRISHIVVPKDEHGQREVVRSTNEERSNRNLQMLCQVHSVNYDKMSESMMNKGIEEILLDIKIDAVKK